jgi:hypothetical protein
MKNGSNTKNTTNEALSVWKYNIPIGDEPTELVMPKGAKFLHVGNQKDVYCIHVWFLVNPALHVETRTFKVHGTGHIINGNQEKYCGTVQISPYVWHLFEVVK